MGHNSKSGLDKDKTIRKIKSDLSSGDNAFYGTIIVCVWSLEPDRANLTGPRGTYRSTTQYRYVLTSCQKSCGLELAFLCLLSTPASQQSQSISSNCPHKPSGSTCPVYRDLRVDHGPERKPQSPESAKEAVNHQDDEEAGKATTALFTEEERRVIEAPFQTIIFLLWSLHDGTNGVLRRAKCSVE